MGDKNSPWRLPVRVNGPWLSSPICRLSRSSWWMTDGQRQTCSVRLAGFGVKGLFGRLGVCCPTQRHCQTFIIISDQMIIGLAPIKARHPNWTIPSINFDTGEKLLISILWSAFNRTVETRKLLTDCLRQLLLWKAESKKQNWSNMCWPPNDLKAVAPLTSNRTQSPRDHLVSVTIWNAFA